MYTLWRRKGGVGVGVGVRGGGEPNEQVVITEDRTGVKQNFKSWVSTNVARKGGV